MFSKMVEVAEDGKFDLACEKEKRLSGIKSQSQSLSDINLWWTLLNSLFTVWE